MRLWHVKFANTDTSQFNFLDPVYPNILNSFMHKQCPGKVQHRINPDCNDTIKDTFITTVLVLQILWVWLKISKPLQLCVEHFYWYCSTEIQNNYCAGFWYLGNHQWDKSVSHTLLTCKAAFCWAAMCCCSAWSRKSLFRAGLESAMLKRKPWLLVYLGLDNLTFRCI
jgi:hypothetical protein